MEVFGIANHNSDVGFAEFKIADMSDSFLYINQFAPFLIYSGF